MKVKMLLIMIIVSSAFLLPSCNSEINPLGSKETPELFPIIQDGKIGYINRKGEIVIQPQFVRTSLDFLTYFSEGLAAVCIEPGKCGYIDEAGKYVINPQFQDVNDFSEGLAAVWVEGKLGYIDRTGKFVINPQFELSKGHRGDGFIIDFSEGLASIKIGDKMGFIDKSGKIVINPQFDLAFPFSESIAAVVIDNKGGFIDKEGKIIINPQFDEVRPFINGLAVVKIGEQFGYIDKTGKIVVNPQFDYALPFSKEGLAFVVTGKGSGPGSEAKYGYIDKDGKYVINPQFTVRGGPFFGNIAPFNINSKFKLLEFSEGLASVIIGDKMGFIDTTGKIVINPQFRAAYSFYGGLAAVVTDSGLAYIDKEGNYVWREAKEIPNTYSNSSVSNSNAAAAGNSNSSISNAVNSNMTSNSSSTSSNQKTGQLVTDSNLRSQPNKDSASVGIHFKDAKVGILDETSYELNGVVSTWYRVRITNYGCSKDTSLGCGKNTPNDADEGWVNAKVVLLN